jgi:hypothetical protein
MVLQVIAKDLYVANAAQAKESVLSHEKLNQRSRLAATGVFWTPRALPIPYRDKLSFVGVVGGSTLDEAG